MKIWREIFRLAVPVLTAAAVLSSGAAGSGGEDASCPALPFDMPEVTEPVFPDRDFVVTDYGAKADPGFMNTEAIARAIKACAEAGGGRVVIPAGTWLTGAVHLKSNINLHLSEGAELVFTTDPDAYLPPVFTRWEGVECYNYSPLIYARDCVKVAVTGKGTLDGQGEAWWSWKTRQGGAVERLYRYGFDGVPVEKRMFGTVGDALRPPLVQFVGCTNVLLADYTARNSPFWTNHLVYCENVTVRGVTALAPAGSPNTDGVNLDSTRNAVVRGVYTSTGDDSVCVKSGRDKDGRRVGRPTENVLIENCRCLYSHGGFVVGSEMSGGIRNIMVRNCVYEKPQRGIRLKSKRGRGGCVKNIRVENVKIEKAAIAVDITAFYGSHRDPPSEHAPVFDGISIKGLACDWAGTAVSVKGLPEEPIKNLRLENLSIKSGKGLQITDASGVEILNSRIDPLWGPVMKLVDCRDVTIQGTAAPFGTWTFLKVEGEQSSGIVMGNNDLDNAIRAKAIGKGAPAGAVSSAP